MGVYIHNFIDDMGTPWDRRPHRKGECRAGGRHQWRGSAPIPPDHMSYHVISIDYQRLKADEQVKH